VLEFIYLHVCVICFQRNAYKTSVKKSDGAKYHSGDLGLDGRITLTL
jgi:hypothetical protein